ncbi:MAG: hypothetical protein KAI66_22265 [Lentisphaeria bacterium]|nr:hypothetical protein [Lentisphaeria bacterium]
MRTDPLQSLTTTATTALRKALPALENPIAFLQLGSTFSASGILEETLGQTSMTEWTGFGDAPSPSLLPLLLTLGTCGGKQVLVAEGHRYAYEGLGLDAVVLPLCVAHACGVRNVILVEPCLSLREDLKAGGWLMATDYTSALSASPLQGNTALLDQPFPSMNHVFSQQLNSELVNALAGAGISPKLGVVHCCQGPQFDSVAQTAAVREGGADAVTLGVVPEAIMGAALGCEVSALLLAAGHAPGHWHKPTTYEDMQETAEFFADKLARSLRTAFASIR